MCRRPRYSRPFDSAHRPGQQFPVPGRLSEDRDAIGQNSRHHEIFGSGDRRDIKVDVRTVEPVASSLDISVLQLDLGAKAGKSLAGAD